MGKANHQMVPAAMVSLREKIQQWRSNKQQRRMPGELWSEAIRLAREYGVHPVSKNVDVSYTRLKKLVEGDVSAARPIQFVEIARQQLDMGLRIEIVRPDGCRMHVHNPGVQTTAELAEVFLGMRR